MPPKAKFTKEQIIDIAFEIVREKGMEYLSARSLAKAMGTSTGPIFTCFDTIEDVQNEVIKKAKVLYAGYIRDGLKQTPAFKGTGMKFIEFAKVEPELFQLLFMSGNGTGNITHFLPYYDENAPLVLEALKDSYGIEEEKAKNIYNHMSVYAFGFAALFAQRICMYTMEDISRMMTEMFVAMIKNEKEGKKK